MSNWEVSVLERALDRAQDYLLIAIDKYGIGSRQFEDAIYDCAVIEWELSQAGGAA